MPVFRCLIAVLLGLGVAFVAAPGASAERYVALGDSYSAGTGLAESDHNWGAASTDVDCHRSPKAYGPLIRSALGASNSFRFAACTGARTGHIISSGQHGNPAQADRLGSDTLDATISIGGNDAGFGDVLLECGKPGWMSDCDGRLDTAQTYITDTLPGLLNNVYNRIRLRAPNARVGVVGYPRLFPANGDDCSAATFFSAAEIARLNQTADLLADVTRTRARAFGFSFVDARPAYLGHAWCEDEWINGLSNPTHRSYHPNQAGYVGFAGITRAAMLAAPSPDFNRGPNGRIYFTSTRDGNPEIYAANADGSHPLNLTSNPGDDEVPAVSPDGNRILFASNRGNAAGNFDIYVMDWNGSNVQRLVGHSANDYEPAWSPNGKQIIFRSDRHGNNEIYKINLDGSNVQDGSANGVAVARLTTDAASDFSPSFSPDGAEIVFQRYSASLGNEIFKMNADGQGQINLTNNATSINDGGPRFSPDGSQIAFHSNRAAGNFEIYTMGATGGTATRRTSNTTDDRYPDWAPSGSQITFQSNRDGAERIYTMTATGGSQVRRTSGGGNDAAPAWQGDSRAPSSSITDGPPAASNQSSATFSFVADEAGSSFQCRLDGGTWGSCVSPFSTGPLDDGDHDFSVRATDPSGNVESSPAGWSFTIDTQAKLTEITGGPSGPTADPEPSFTFTSEHSGLTFECRLTIDGVPGEWEGCVSPWQPGALADGNYSFEVRGIDGVGNVEDPPQRLDFLIDTAAPTASLTAGPAPVGNDPAPVFEFTTDEPGVSFECQLAEAGQPGTWEPCDSPWQAGTPLSDGDFSFSVRASDLAGNLGPQSSLHPFKIDTEAPQATIDSAPGLEHDSVDVTFEFSSPDPEAGFECRLDNLDEAGWQHCESPLEISGLSHGQHEFQVRASDPAGNVQPVPTSHEFGIKVVPDFEVTQRPAELSADQRPKFKFSSDDPGAVFECRLDGGDWVECGTPYDPTVDPENPDQPQPPLADGRHLMEIRGIDSFGEVTVLDPVEWVIDSAVPVARILSGPDPLVNSKAASFRIDPGRSGVTLECRIDNWAGNVCPAQAEEGQPFEITIPNLHDAAHSLRVWAVGPLSGAGPVDSWEWSIDTATPQVEITAGPRGRSASSTATFQFGSNDPEATFECRLEGVQFAACTSPRTLNFIPDGPQRFEVRARDGAGNVSAARGWNWTVDTIGPQVTLTGVPADGSRPGQVEFGFGADETGVLFSCRLDGGDWLSCRSPFPLTVGAGSHQFEVRAIDDLGNAGETASHSWNAVRPAAPGRRPAIRFNRSVRVKRAAKVRLATVTCERRCQVTAPRRVKVRVGRQNFRVPLIVPQKKVTGRKAVSLRVTARLRRTLTRRQGRVRLQIRAVSADGSRRVTATVRLRR